MSENDSISLRRPPGADPSTRQEGMMALRDVQHWFLDLDGTVYLSGEPLPGALELIEYLHRNGSGYTFLTNNSSHSSLEYASKLERLGFPVGRHNIFTSGQATGELIAREHPGARVYLLGTPSLAAEFASAGVQVVEDEPDMVVLGFDPSLSFSRLTRACTLLRSGVRYLATHPDANCPVSGGYIPDAGSVMALIEAATGRTPEVVVGKPNARFIEEAATQVGVSLRNCAMVGDRLETDIAMALEVGIPGILVLSGATQSDDQRLQQSPWQERVTVLHGLDGLLRELDGSAGWRGQGAA